MLVVAHSRDVYNDGIIASVMGEVMHRRQFLQATSLAVATASMSSSGRARAAGIAERYAAVTPGRYLSDLKTLAKVEDKKVFTEGPCCDRSGNVFFTNTQA